MYTPKDLTLNLQYAIMKIPKGNGACSNEMPSGKNETGKQANSGQLVSPKSYRVT